MSRPSTTGAAYSSAGSGSVSASSPRGGGTRCRNGATRCGERLRPLLPFTGDCDSSLRCSRGGGVTAAGSESVAPTRVVAGSKIADSPRVLHSTANHDRYAAEQGLRRHVKWLPHHKRKLPEPLEGQGAKRHYLDCNSGSETLPHLDAPPTPGSTLEHCGGSGTPPRLLV